MQSPLSGLFGNFVKVFLPVGILAAIFFHPGLLCSVMLGLFLVLLLFNDFDNEVTKQDERQNAKRNSKLAKAGTRKRIRQQGLHRSK